MVGGQKTGDARCVGRGRHRGDIFVGAVDREGCRSNARELSTGNVRRRVSVSFSPWRGEVRTLLREARTSRCTARYGHRGTRVGEAAHPGPTRRLRRVVDARNVVRRLSTQATVVDSSDSDDEMPLMRRSIGPKDGLEQELEGDVFLPQTFVMSDGICPEQRGQCVAPRPSRRLVLVPQSVDGTPQSIQDREWDAGVETHNRFSPVQDAQVEGMPIVGVSGSDTESDLPSRRRRLRVVWNADPHSEAQTALTLLQVLARRVGAVPVGAPVPVAIRHHQWSPLFVPSLWGASGVDATTPALDILVSTVSVVSEPIQFRGSDIFSNESRQSRVAQS